MADPSSCTTCGMADVGAPKYHPYAACLMMKAAKNGATVEANLRAVVEYGMRAQGAGLTLDQAMDSIVWMHASPPPSGQKGR